MTAPTENHPDGQGDTPGVPPWDALAALVAVGEQPTIGDAYRLYRLRTHLDLVTAGRFFGLSKNVSYDLRKQGKFPVRVLTLGGQYVVLTADLLRALSLPLTA